MMLLNIKRILFKKKLYAVIIIAILAASTCSKKTEISLHNGNWDSIQLINQIFKFIVEKGYGYRIILKDISELEMHLGFESGDIDIITELWIENQPHWYAKQIKSGNLINAGKIIDYGAQVWIIPRWVSAKYNIKTVFDMKKKWRLFTDSDHPYKGIFYNCIYGWECKGINEVKLEAYGLGKFYDSVSPSSGDALEKILIKAQENKNPVFSYYWLPTPLISIYDWHYLEEPEYNAPTYSSLISAVRNKSLRPVKNACAYSRIAVIKAINIKILKKTPEVVEMTKKMFIKNKLLLKLLKWRYNSKTGNWEQTAVHFLNNNEEIWKTWVTTDAYKKIKTALKKSTAEE